MAALNYSISEEFATVQLPDKSNYTNPTVPLGSVDDMRTSTKTIGTDSGRGTATGYFTIQFIGKRSGNEVVLAEWLFTSKDDREKEFVRLGNYEFDGGTGGEKSTADKVQVIIEDLTVNSNIDMSDYVRAYPDAHEYVIIVMSDNGRSQLSLAPATDTGVAGKRYTVKALGSIGNGTKIVTAGQLIDGAGNAISIRDKETVKLACSKDNGYYTI